MVNVNDIIYFFVTRISEHCGSIMKAVESKRTVGTTSKDVVPIEDVVPIVHQIIICRSV